MSAEGWVTRTRAFAASIAVLVALFAVTLFLVLTPLSAHAQPAPADITLGADLAIPPAPDGFVEQTRGAVRWEYPERARDLVEPLFDAWDRALPRIQQELGTEGEALPVRVRVGVDPEQMTALAPPAAPPPAYAVGVAYPGLSLILLTLTAPDTWQRPGLEGVLVHELSHIALHTALGTSEGRGNDVPLWFVEGVAIYQARERSIERVETLWTATFRGGVIPLDDLDERFPSRPHEVSLAYAESADFVAWLIRRSGPEKLGELVGRVRRGQDFELAVTQTWSAGLGALELAWREDLSGRYGALPMFASGSVGWVLAGMLVFAGLRRRRERRAEIEKRWDEEDAREERIARALARHRAQLLARERALRAAALAGEDEGEDEGGHEGEREPADELAIVVSIQEEKPTTVFVVGSEVGPEAAPEVGPAEPGSAGEPSTFETDVDRSGRTIH